MQRSHELFLEAQRYIPGGVNSPVRAFRAVGGEPLFIKRGEGPYLIDEDGRQYIDYVASWGPLIAGHAHPRVIEAVKEMAERGLGFGAPTAIEVEMARTLCRLVPSLEEVRMVNSGTEATMSAIRLARAYTGRDMIAKFEGCYHGHADALLVKAGSGALTHGTPSSPGVPASLARHTLTLTYNDLDSVQDAFNRHGRDIACVIVEPVAGNMNCIPPLPGFLETLRQICHDYGALLIFDEVMTGFRVALGGAQDLYGVIPDLTTLGKIIGGGLPVGAFGGKREIMELLSPQGPVYQAGTLSGNPVALAAGLATLTLVEENGFYDRLSQATQRLVQGVLERAQTARVPMTANAVGGMFGFFFTEEPEVRFYEQVVASFVERFQRFFHGMLQEGVYLAPSPFEAGFVSSAHTPEVIDATLDAAEKVLTAL